jgi:DNA-binding IclR family transcriptional regulator
VTRPFTAVELAHVSKISKARAEEFLLGFIEHGLVVPLGDGRYDLTRRGLSFSRALAGCDFRTEAPSEPTWAEART